jgi:hypothetical protein
VENIQKALTMTINQFPAFRLLFIMTALVLLGGCAAGSDQFTTESPAGFWYGLWHGIISIISLVIHIFNESVRIYEINNTGGWYDFGFLLGAICIWGGGSHYSCKTAKEKKRDKEWDEIGDKVEKKVMRKMKAWADDEQATTDEDDWEEVSKKFEKKLKRKIREWAEKE